VVAATVGAGDNSIALFADKGIALVDLTDPTSPVRGPEGPTDGKVVAVEYDEVRGVAYAADATGKLYLFAARSVDGFAKLFEAFSATLANQVVGMARLGSTLYLLTADAMVPVTFTFTGDVPDGSRFGAAIPLGGLAAFIAAGGDTVYVALRTGEVQAWSAPAIGSPVKLGQYLLSAEPRTLLAKGSKVLVGVAGTGLVVLDFGNPVVPVQLALDRSMYDLVFARLFGRTLAVGLERNLVATVDLSDFSAPRVLTVDPGPLPEYLAVVNGVVFRGVGTTATVANLPPTVSVSMPPLTAASFPLHGQIPVTFGKPIDAATATSLYVTLTCGGVRVSGTVIVSLARTALTFLPDQLLPALSACTLDLSGVRDAYGQGVVGGSSVAVTTAAQPGQAMTIPGSRYPHTPDGQFTGFDPVSGANVGEWSDVAPAKGMYTYFYGDYQDGKLNILNDWFFNGDKIDPDCYNEFYVWTGGGSEQWTIRAYADRKVTVLKNGVLVDPATSGVSGSAGYGPSPNVAAPHTIYELQIAAQPGAWGVRLHDPGPTYHCSRLESEPSHIQGTLGVGSTVGGLTVDSTIKPQVPAAPLLLAPVNGAATGTVMPTLVWTTADSAALSMVQYQVQIAKVPTFASLVWNVSTTSRSYTVPAGVLGIDKTYYWRIIASNAAGQNASFVLAFTTGKQVVGADAGIDAQPPFAKEAGVLDVGQGDLPPKVADAAADLVDAPVIDAGPGRALTVTFAEVSWSGAVIPGQGTVTSEPTGITCTNGDGACSAFFNLGTSVLLFSKAATGWHFVSWSGDCAASGTSAQARIAITKGEEPLTCIVRFEADVPDGSVITPDAGGVCSAVSDVKSCTNGTAPEIKLAGLDATACREQCPAAMVAAGMTSGCWVLGLDGFCYCRNGVLNSGGTASGGTCVLGTGGFGGAGGSGGRTGLGGAGGSGGVTGLGGVGGGGGGTAGTLRGGAGGTAGVGTGGTGTGGTGTGGTGTGGTAGAAGCLEPDITTAPVVTASVATGSAPAPAGGAIHAGTYFLTESVVYVVSGDPPSNSYAQQVLVIAGPSESGEWTSHMAIKRGDNAPQYRTSTFPTPTGTTMTGTAVCPAGAPTSTTGYSTTDTTLTIFTDNSSYSVVSTLTLQ
jgi:hypothetical protein